MQLMIKELKTELDAFSLFKLFKNEKQVIFLDSGMNPENLGRYSIIVFNPFATLKCKRGLVEINKANKRHIKEGKAFAALRELLQEYSFTNTTNLPFIAGGVGYLAYDLCREIENIPETGKDDIDIPDLYFNFYQSSIVVDNLQKKVYATFLNKDNNGENPIEYIETIISSGKLEFPEENLDVNKAIESNFNKEEYLKSIKKVKEYIRQGDVYEVNLTQRFSAPITKTPCEVYASLRGINKAPFAAFMKLDGFSIVSSSPERFIKVKDGNIETRPIKGTIKRGNCSEEDAKNREQLAQSEKDKAELLMIVDLERNDLSRICKKGTLNVEELFKIEEYPTVFHLVSTITGQLKENIDIVDCLNATFPGGSITGAPKIRSMEIIDELEPNLRSIYTGSLGYLGFDGNADLNIVIRTIVIKNQQAYFGVGGAITWDSDPDAEYRETLDKGVALMRVL